MGALLPIALTLMAATTRPAAEIPVVFAHGGRSVEVPLAPAASQPASVVLRAFGRESGESATVRDSKVQVNVPEVRVATVLSVVDAQRPERELAQVVAYPDNAIRWSDGPVEMYSLDAPAWFEQWAAATGARLQRLDREELAGRQRPRSEDLAEVLVLGASAAGRHPDDVRRLADDEQIGVLVLDASWFADPLQGRAVVRPENMCGPLSSIRDQRWHKPIVVRPSVGPWVGTANRIAWIQPEGLPLVEQLGWPTKRPRIVLSYLPWEQQLGRVDVADETLEAVIRATTSPAEDEDVRQSMQLLYPTRWDKPWEQIQAERPVLAAAITGSRSVALGARSLAVVDLRGKQDTPRELLAVLEELQDRINRDHPLVILGDDPMLDGWKWLGLDRATQTHKRAEAPGFTWLSDDGLPPSGAARIRLMNVFSNYGVPLTSTEQEK